MKFGWLMQSIRAIASDLCIYRTMLGGASFKDWYDTYNDAYPWQDYQVLKVLGGIDAVRQDVEPSNIRDKSKFWPADLQNTINE